MKENKAQGPPRLVFIKEVVRNPRGKTTKGENTGSRENLEEGDFFIERTGGH